MLVPMFQCSSTHRLHCTSGECFSDRPSCLKVSSFPAAGKDAEDEWHRWPANTSRDMWLRQMSLVTFAVLKDLPSDWAETRGGCCSSTDRRVMGTQKNGLLQMAAWLISDPNLLFCLLPVWATWLSENKHQTFWSLKTFQALPSDAGNKSWDPYNPWGYYCLHKWT